MKYSSRYGGFEDRCDEENLLGFRSHVRCVVELLTLSPSLAERLSQAVMMRKTMIGKMPHGLLQ